jgi:HK97 family phage prohead protease
MTPTDNLVRLDTLEKMELRADAEGDGNTLFGHFAVFDRWTTIDSWYEGTFLERIARGAFNQTFTDRAAQIRLLYDHGSDPSIGNKPLGTIDVLREDKTGAYYEASLFDTNYVNELRPALRAGQMGASFRFRVTAESWNEPKAATKSNPMKLPERTVTGVELYEFGPVTFPAYPDGTTPGMRSRSDEFLERMLNDPKFIARFTERAGLTVVERILSNVPAVGRTEEQPPESSGAAVGHPLVSTNNPRTSAAVAELLRLKGHK